MATRKIVRIDEEKCDGCGLCVPTCAEGAIQIVDGKARLLAEAYCDGLGACLGECPKEAISVEERLADEFDLEAVRVLHPKSAAAGHGHARPTQTTPSSLANWPIQIKLAPVRAPHLDGAKLLVAADCVPFAAADFHRRFLGGRVVLVGCPKLDDAELYRRKLTQILLQNDIREVEVIHMEVPCCFGLVNLVKQAVSESGKDVALTATEIGVAGEVIEPAGRKVVG